MRIYLLSLGAGLLVGVIYSILGVRSPAPPLVALLGLAGILLGEQAWPMVRGMAAPAELARFVKHDRDRHGAGALPDHTAAQDDAGRDRAG